MDSSRLEMISSITIYYYAITPPHVTDLITYGKCKDRIYVLTYFTYMSTYSAMMFFIIRYPYILKVVALFTVPGDGGGRSNTD